MPLDEYDFQHYPKFYKTINIYHDSNLDQIIDEYVKEDMKYFTDIHPDELESNKKQIHKLVSKLRNGFSILDDRYITCVSARLINNQKNNKPNKDTMFNCINVFRG